MQSKDFRPTIHKYKESIGKETSINSKIDPPSPSLLSFALTMEVLKYFLRNRMMNN